MHLDRFLTGDEYLVIKSLEKILYTCFECFFVDLLNAYVWMLCLDVMYVCMADFLHWSLLIFCIGLS